MCALFGATSRELIGKSGEAKKAFDSGAAFMLKFRPALGMCCPPATVTIVSATTTAALIPLEGPTLISPRPLTLADVRR